MTVFAWEKGGAQEVLGIAADYSLLFGKVYWWWFACWCFRCPKRDYELFSRLMVPYTKQETLSGETH